MNDKQTPLLIPLAAIIVFAAGCSGGADVRGLVTLDEQPVKGALVTFLGEGGKAIPAMADDDGNYRLIGNVESRIPVGKYKVVVVKEALKDGTVPTGEALLQARAKGLLLNYLPKKYAHADSTPLIFDVGSGRNTINLELKK